MAAAVGLAQSMYEIERFVDVNVRGTAIVLEEIVKRKGHVGRLVVASSMSLYGEGRCSCAACGDFSPTLRAEVQLAAKDFEIRCPRCEAVATPVPTPESAPLTPTTVYAITKRDQEELVLAIGGAYGIRTAALRLFNVYGPRQSLSNPYTGVAAIFASRLITGGAPMVFEDGLQTRDFTHVTDVAEAFRRALIHPDVSGVVLNVGAGRPHTLLDLGDLLAREIGVAWRPNVTASFRKGDIRHCTADTSSLEKTLGFRPSVDFKDGVRDLVEWARTQRPTDRVDAAHSELSKHGLVS
jgi:dTDP-L-rhamnose 4-epimerase